MPGVRGAAFLRSCRVSDPSLFAEIFQLWWLETLRMNLPEVCRLVYYLQIFQAKSPLSFAFVEIVRQ